MTARGSNAVIAAISVRLSNPAKTPAMIVQVPLGIAIADQIRVGFPNGMVQTLPVTTCNRNGCFGAADVGTPLLSAMRDAKQPLQIAYESLDANFNKETVTIRLGLNGFADMYGKLK